MNMKRDEEVKSVAVFCGSAEGKNPKHREFARKLGEWIARRDLTLVYGGASIGIMNIVADGVSNCGGKVIGVIPEVISGYEIAKKNIYKLIEVKSMHERKQIMYDLSDLFLILPGGIGTLDELFEIATWKQLQLHNKKIVLCNIDGFFTKLFEYLKHAQGEGFISEKHLLYFEEVHSIEELDNVLLGKCLFKEVCL